MHFSIKVYFFIQRTHHRVVVACLAYLNNPPLIIHYLNQHSLFLVLIVFLQHSHKPRLGWVAILMVMIHVVVVVVYYYLHLDKM